MIQIVTITHTEFIPLRDSEEFVFVFFTRAHSGKTYNIEEYGTKTELCSRYGIADIHFSEWNEKAFTGRKCKIRIGRFWGNKFIEFTEAQKN